MPIKRGRGRMDCNEIATRRGCRARRRQEDGKGAGRASQRWTGGSAVSAKGLRAGSGAVGATGATGAGSGR